MAKKSKVEETAWTAAGVPHNSLIRTEWMEPQKAEKIFEELQSKGIRSNIAGAIGNRTNQVCVYSIDENGKFMPENVTKFKNAFPQASVRNLQKDFQSNSFSHFPPDKNWDIPDNSDDSEKINLHQEAVDGRKERKSKIDREALGIILNELDEFVELKKAKEQLMEIIDEIEFNIMQEEMLGIKNEADEKPSYHIMLKGPSGTGKTTFARVIAKAFHALGILETDNFLEVLPKDLIGNHVGDTEKQTSEILEKGRGGVLFVDEIHNLKADGKFDKKAISTIVPMIENYRDEMIFIGAGYSDEIEEFLDADKGLRGRVSIHIDFESFTNKGLGKILDQKLAKKNYTIAPKARKMAIKLLEKKKENDPENFANGRDARNLVEAIHRSHAVRMKSKKTADRLKIFNEKSSDERRTATKKLLLHITPEDVKNVKFMTKRSSNNPSETKRRIGFGGWK